MALDGFTEIAEGQTQILVPTTSLSAHVPPKQPAFFNPAARLSRDLSIVVCKSYCLGIGNEITFADAFAGVGARGIRVAKEVPRIDHVYLNDVNPKAIEAARFSAKINSVESKCVFSVSEVCKFLGSGSEGGGRFSMVDLDPFGTPARHLDCALRSLSDGGLISITATDTAVLAGIYPDVCRRRYYGRPINSAYGKEVALRLVASLLALTASRLDLGIRPVFSHAFQHYLRVYAILSVSNIAANGVLANLGYIEHCFSCGYRAKAEKACMEKCPLCGDRLSIGGPLWTGRIHDTELVRGMSSQDSSSQCVKIINSTLQELPEVPYYYRVDEISSRLKTNPPSLIHVINRMRECGHRASPVALDPSGFKTDARIDEVLRTLK